MTATAMNPISKKKNNKFCTSSGLFFYNLYEHHRKKIRFATLFGGRKHRDKFNFFADPNLDAVPKTPQGSSPIFAILRELTEINSKKLLKKKKKDFVSGPRRRRC